MQLKSFSPAFFYEPRVLGALLSILLSVIMGIDFFINPDGIFYLKGAEDLLTNGLSATHPSLRWPFYPILIACFTYITHLPFLYSALILQAILQILLIISFINVIRICGGNRTIQYLAVATLLLHPELNEYRGLIIRDFGYWAFLFTSFYYLIRYWQQPTWRALCAYTFFITIALLFRIEGIVIIVLAPLIGFLVPNLNFKTRLLEIGRLYLPWALITAAFIIFLLAQQQHLATFGRLAELPMWWNYLTGALTAPWENIQAPLTQVFPHMYEESIKIFMIGGLAAYVIYELVSVLNVLFLGLVIYGQWQQYLAKYCGALERRIIYAFLAINFLIPVVFVSGKWFLRGRFLMPTALILLLWVPFTLYELYQSWKHSQYFLRYQRYAHVLLACLVIFLLIDTTISFNSPAAIIKESATWIQTQTPSNATVFTNNPQIAFYANRPGTDFNMNPLTKPLPDMLAQDKWKHYDYLVVVIKRKDQATEDLLAQTIPYPPLQQFENRRGYKVFIYKVEH